MVGLLVSALTTGAAAAALAAEVHHDTGSLRSTDRIANRASAAQTTNEPASTSNAAAESDRNSGSSRICDKYGSTSIEGGKYMVQNDEWGANDGQCITAGIAGFTVDSGDHHKSNAPAGFPSIETGCWMGNCTTGTTLPTQISALGPISSSIAGTIPPGTKSNMAFDIWADHTAKKSGQNDAMELMIWLNETGGIKPIGTKTGTAGIGGATWDVYKGTNGPNVISYVRHGYVAAADNLPLTDFVHNAVQQGSVKDTDYLTNIQAGFEPWQGGPGLALTNFSVTYPGTGQKPTANSSPNTGLPSDRPEAASSPAAVAPSVRPSPEPDLWFCPTATDPGTTNNLATRTGGTGASAPGLPGGPGQEPGSAEYERSPGMNTCTAGTTLPRQISALGPISSSIAGTIPPGTKSNLAYDIWADHAPKKNGQNNAVELMIWLKEAGGIKPIGQKTSTAVIGGATWDVWKGTNGGVNVISYVRQRYVDAADDLPITDFVKDAVKQGSVTDSDYLTNIQAGFEPWSGGPGLTLSHFSVNETGPAPAATGGAGGGGGVSAGAVVVLPLAAYLRRRRGQHLTSTLGARR